LADLVALTGSSAVISGRIAKEVLAKMFETGKDALTIVNEEKLAQVSDAPAIEAFADEAIAGNPKSVADYKGGNLGALNFLKGQVMKLSKGKANPQLAGEILMRKLGS
jgi:aspartyl-tRNA(Asn)/glutamyl-tRNA(Gln) amidotransferase subunit B